MPPAPIRAFSDTAMGAPADHTVAPRYRPADRKRRTCPPGRPQRARPAGGCRVEANAVEAEVAGMSASNSIKYWPILARTATINRPVGPVAFDCVRLSFVRAGRRVSSASSDDGGHARVMPFCSPQYAVVKRAR